MIAFTGSPAVGRRIGELAGRHLKKVSLELGGANNLIVLDDADLDAAASAVAFGAWFHQGQICMASNRVLVHEAVAEGMRQRLVGKATHLPVGDGASGQVALGPMIDKKQLDRFDAVVKDSVKAGATLEAGGSFEGLCYKPTVLSGVKPGMRSFDEEPFGPVVNLISFRTDDEAVALANNSQGGLAAAVISKDIARAMAIGERVKAGMVHINDQTVNDECTNPFGGPGLGGNGSAVGGPADIDEYTRWQWVTVRVRRCLPSPSDRRESHPMKLQGKTIVITGSSSGIGAETARYLRLSRCPGDRYRSQRSNGSPSTASSRPISPSKPRSMRLWPNCPSASMRCATSRACPAPPRWTSSAA